MTDAPRRPMSVPTFASLLEKNRPLLPAYEDIVRHGRVAFTPAADTDFVIGHRPGPYDGFILEARKGGASAMVELFVTAHLLADGPKLYRPSPDQAEALANVQPEV